ncbi:MAG: helix-turn-helix domain-containing protein, partial [Holophagales bacterium]|nr:helix-turn-helix domain-containing protein [Holophagales bacterium]
MAQWPASGWSPLTVLQAVPSIRLRNSSDTSDIPKSIGIYWELTTGQTARLYVELNGVRDTNPPAGLAWSYRPAGTFSETEIPGGQGASFSISTTGEYEIVLRGYGLDVIANVGVSTAGGGGGGTPPTVSAVTFSKTKPAVGELVTVSCVATQGTSAIGSYLISFGDGQGYAGAASSTSHSWATEGTKTVACTAYDVTGLASAARYALIDVGGPDVGPTVTAIAVTPEFLRPGTLATLTCLAVPPPGRLIVGYEFDFGDSSTLVNGPSNTATHVYQAVGTYPATCRAYDASARSGFLQKGVVVYAPSYTLQVKRIGSGSGLVYSNPSGLSCGSVCSADFATGSTVTLTALASPGSRFAGWSEPSCLDVAAQDVVHPGLRGKLVLRSISEPTEVARVNLHRRARTTPESRALLARRVFEEGWSRRRAGRAFGISLPTVRKWLARWEMEGAAGLGDRSSRPQRSPRRIRTRDRQRIVDLRRQKRTAVAIAEITGISRATVGRVLRSERLSRWKSLFPREPDRRYERAVAGELLHMDIKKLGRIVGGPGHRVTGDRRGQREGSGWECAHVCVDDHSRLSYVEVLPDEKRETTSAFL